ncbi:MAG: hypothetical protein JOZ04_07410, partial [Acidimicrobiia bacterium]|nr:hypothetical protein [Acidimicrobiia bacterium]
MVAARLGHEMALPQLYAGMSYLTPEEAESAATLLPHFVSISEDGFPLVVDYTIAAIESCAPAPTPAAGQARSM